MKRRYKVDDCDYEDYRRKGGTLSPAEFFNSRLGANRTMTDSISKRLAVALNEPSRPPANLTERIKALL